MIENRIAMLRELRELSWAKEGWFAPLAAALEGVGPAEAAWQPPGGGNTIWQTVNHLNYYNEWMLHRMTGQSTGALVDSNILTFGGPGDPADAAGWQSTLEKTREIAEGLKAALASMSDGDLDQPLTKGTVGDGLVSWIMHDAHHAGQIVLIRKQQGSWPAKRG